MAYTSISDRTRYERISSLFSYSFNHFHRCHGSGTRSIKIWSNAYMHISYVTYVNVVTINVNVKTNTYCYIKVINRLKGWSCDPG